MSGIKNFITFFLSNTILSIINFLMLPFYSKYISVEDFGIYSLLLLFISISSIFVDFGLTSSFSIKFHKSSIEQRGALISSTFAIYIIFSLFLILLFASNNILMKSLFRIEISETVKLKSILVVILTCYSNFMLNIFILEQKALHYSVINLSKAILFASLNFYFLIKLSRGYQSYIDSMIFSMSFVVIVAGFYVKKKYPIDITNFLLVLKKDNIRNSISLVLHNLAGNISEWSGRYIINILMSLASLGIYNMGYRFGSFFYSFIYSPLGQVEWPIIAKSFNESKKKFSGNLNLFLRINMNLCFLVAIGMYLILDYYFFYSIDFKYWESYEYIMPVALGFVTLGCYQSLTAPFMLYEKTYFIPIFTSISAIINMIISYGLIIKYSIWGASFSPIITNIIMFIILKIILKNRWLIDVSKLKVFTEYSVMCLFMFFMQLIAKIAPFDYLVFLIKISLVLGVVLVQIYFFRNEIKNTRFKNDNS